MEVSEQAVKETHCEMANIEGELCLHKKTKNEDVWVRKANFAIEAIEAILKARDESESLGCFKIRVRKPNEERGLLVHMPIEAMQTEKDIAQAFFKSDPTLMCVGLKTDMLMTVLTQLECPTPQKCITHFGRQPKSDLYVMSNCCFVNGRVADLSRIDAHVLLLLQPTARRAAP